MPSPYPGMDPYLEISGDWRDFHATFITTSRLAINPQLPEDYIARIEERFTLVEVPADRGPGRYPDVSVVRTAPAVPGRRPPQAGGLATREPVTVRLSPARTEEVREAYIEIRRRPDWDLVTSIELLSPANKAEPGFTEYRTKRTALLGQQVHLVELDFLTAGHRLPADDPLPLGDYYAFVSRAELRPESQVYAWTVRDPLPTIPVPLRTPDPDVALDLAAVFAETYRQGMYERSINYAAPLSLPLAADDRAWAEAIARTGAR